MTFDTLSGSRNQARPVRLFQFQYGPSGFYRFTDGDAPVIYNADTYDPLTPLSVSAVRTAGDGDRETVRITMASGTGLEDLYLVYPPSEPVSVIVWYGHVGDTDFRLGYSGSIQSVTREDGEVVLDCRNHRSALARPGLRRTFSIACPRVLYRGGCPASEAAATTMHTVTAIPQPNVITLAPGWHGAQPVDKYRGGMVKWTNTVGGTEVRGINRAAATDLTLGGPVRDLAVSDTVSVALGCNRLMDDCDLLHGVIRSFGGWPFIPTENPWEVRNVFY